MGLFSIINLMPTIHTHFPKRPLYTNNFTEEYPRVPLKIWKNRKPVVHSRIIPWSKKSTFQDFQSFAEPLHLLPVSEASFCTESVLEEVLPSFVLENYLSLYIVQLHTSSEFGSSLRDLNAAILLCLIDVDGNSLLQRIGATSSEHHGHEEDITLLEKIHFQRGSMETTTFKGPKLGEIKALWIGLESGGWRLGGVNLTVISRHQSSSSSTEYLKESLYNFETDDILLGEHGGVSMVELRPQFLSELPLVNTSTSFSMASSILPSVSNQNMSNEDSMKDYADLKLSLLFYDFMLVSTGTAFATISVSEKASYAFLVGGITGFLYLLLLQKSVDGLSSSTLPSMDRKDESVVVRAFGGFKGPLSSLALILAGTAVIVNYGVGSASTALTPEELFLGVAGFLTCKIAVVLAAFKPLQTSLKQNK